MHSIDPRAGVRPPRWRSRPVRKCPRRSRFGSLADSQVHLHGLTRPLQAEADHPTNAVRPKGAEQRLNARDCLAIPGNDHIPCRTPAAALGPPDWTLITIAPVPKPSTETG